MSRADAFTYAREQGIDLVLVAPGTNPPVVKAIDINKYRYQEAKKVQEGKKGVKKNVLKDLQLSLFADTADVERLQKKATAFLEEGLQVRLRLTLWGRQLGKRDMAIGVMNQFIAGIAIAEATAPPKFQGKMLSTIISRRKNEKKAEITQSSS